MHRALVVLLCSFTALAQIPQRSPLEDAIQAYHKARGEGRYDVAATRRSEARELLGNVPVQAPQFANWVQSVAQLYTQDGMEAQSRVVLEQALARTSGLGESDPGRVQLLSALSEFWSQDRNLLKAVEYLEKAAAAAASAPKTGSSAPTIPRQAATRFYSPGSRVIIRGGVPSTLTYNYHRLGMLYQQLGRPDAVNAVLAKLKALGPDGESTLAGFLDGQGRIEEAAAIYQKMAEESAGDPIQTVNALRSLAYLYQRDQRFSDAAATFHKALAIIESTDNPNTRMQANSMRMEMARMLQEAGNTEQADKIYQQMAAGTNGSEQQMVLQGYANHLIESQRPQQALKMMKDYLAAHPDMQPGNEMSLLSMMQRAATDAGDTDAVASYRKIFEEKAKAQRQAATQQPRTSGLLEQAQAAASKNPDAAFGLALEALEAAAAPAANREQVVWMVPNVAGQLAEKQKLDQAEQLYQRLFALVQSWSGETLQPAVNVAQNYARFLMMQEKRRAEVPAAIERYKSLLIASHGEGTGWQAEALRMTIEFERADGSTTRAVAAGQDLLALEASLSGTTSESYLRALETMAEIYDASGDIDQELALRRQAITLSDLVCAANDYQRANSRMAAALALARAQQIDEAERLASEAVALSNSMRPRQPGMFSGALEEIRAMRK